MAPPFIYINGFPAVGKLAVALQLTRLLPESKLLDNHKLIDPAGAVFGREMPEYQVLRKQVRQAVLQAIAGAESTKGTTFIFTDFQSDDQIGVATVQDYIDAANVRRSRIYSVVLDCDTASNEQRLLNAERGGIINGKLRDLDILRTARREETIYRFGPPYEKEFDTTHQTPQQTARAIAEWIGSFHD